MRKQPIFCDPAISKEFLRGNQWWHRIIVGCFFRLQINSKQYNTVNNPLSYRGIPYLCQLVKWPYCMFTFRIIKWPPTINEEQYSMKYLIILRCRGMQAVSSLNSSKKHFFLKFVNFFIIIRVWVIFTKTTGSSNAVLSDYHFKYYYR